MSSTPTTAGKLAPLEPAAQGVWDRRVAAHLLWRTQFGATFEEIARAADEGLARTLERLLTPQRESDEFLATEALLRQTALATGEIADLKAWWLYRMLRSANPLIEKLSVFWHNHFATSNAKVNSVAHMAAQNDLIRRHAIGSFRDLLHAMARDTAMLIWLDGNANRKRHANENFARELMELFSLGEGNYTEADILEAARAFSGWHVRDGMFWFNELQHDSGEKTVFGRTGRWNGGDIIEFCLEQPACPRFLAGKLLRMFVTDRPQPADVAAVAERIRTHDFRMSGVLRELFASELFFRPEHRHAMIKGPLDYVLGAQRALRARVNLQSTSRLLAELGQDVFEPATVKGWEGGRLWINSATLLARTNFAAELVGGAQYGTIADPSVDAAGRPIAEPLAHYAELLLARDLSPKALAELQDYQGDTGRDVRGMLQLILSMPECQLM